MKKNRVIISVALLIVFGFTCLPMVSAEENCTEHKNYYFFNAINKKSYFDNEFSNPQMGADDLLQFTTYSYFPKLEDGAIIDNENSGRVCLSKGGDADGNNCKETWTLDDFYNRHRAISTSNLTIATPEGEQTYRVEEQNGTKYFVHGRWFNVTGEGSQDMGNSEQSYDQIAVSDLVGGSFLPQLTEITFDTTGIAIKGSVLRKIKKSDYINDQTIVPFNMTWAAGEGAVSTTVEEPTVLNPALYVLTYKTCEKYKAVIDYFYAGTEDRIEVEDNPYIENNLEDGYENEVTSPKLEGCVPDMKKVNVKIEGKDFYQAVYYTCEIDGPGDTGSALIYIAWAIGAGALGYSVYYLLKNKPKKIK